MSLVPDLGGVTLATAWVLCASMFPRSVGHLHPGPASHCYLDRFPPASYSLHDGSCCVLGSLFASILL